MKAKSTLTFLAVLVVAGASALSVPAQCAIPSFNFLPNTANPNVNGSRPASGDFNRDGLLDVAFSNPSLDTITIALGNGLGGFTSSNITMGDMPAKISVGDFNRNGILDLAVAHGAAAGNISILLGTGNGTFTNGTPIVGDANIEIAVNDFNRDGIEDILTRHVNNGFKVYLGNGSGGFVAQTPVIADGVITQPAVGDINRDGRVDVAFSQFQSARVAVFLGNGTGGFGTQTNFGVGTAPDPIKLVDVNGDNRLDLIAGNVDADTISVLLGNGSGGFGAVTDYPTDMEPRTIDTGDINRDGKPDLVIGHGTFSGQPQVGIFKNIGNGMFAPRSNLPVGGFANRALVGDFTNDGKDDVFVTVQIAQVPDFFGLLINTCNVAPDKDLTGDGRSDIVLFRPSTGFWFVLRTEDFSFFSFPFGQNGDIPAPADFDGDGRADPAIFRPSNSTWFISRSTGGTTIAPFGISTDLPSPADYDGDGKADIAIFRPSESEWWILRSSGGIAAAQFGAPGDIPIR